MALAIVGQVGDFVPSPRRSAIGVIPLSRGCLLHPNVRQMLIMHPDIAFELSKQRTAVKRYIRECLSLVPRPTHALHLAPAIGPHDGICLPARHWPPRPPCADGEGRQLCPLAGHVGKRRAFTELLPTRDGK